MLIQPFVQHPSHALPTSHTKQDALSNQDDTSGSKLSVADSLVLLQSLKQSRSMWLTKAFLRFSTRSKNKADQVVPAPPPHSIYTAGTCDLEIGPHLFPQTKVFFVQYQYGHTSTPTPVPPPTPAPASAPIVPPVSTSTSSQHVAPITVSHELHTRVLAAAAKDPELHTILQLAAQGRANVTQLRTLGTTIKAIEAGTYPSAAVTPTVTQASAAATTASSSAASTPRAVPALVTQAQAQAQTQAPVAPASTNLSSSISAPGAPIVPTIQTTPTSSTSVVPTIPTTAVLLEFAERPIDRWLLPSEYVLLDQRPNGDILLSTFYPFDAYVPGSSAVAARSKPAHPLTLRFVSAPPGVWNALSRTCTTVSPANVQSVLGEVILTVPARTYLQYRIAPGVLWEDLKQKNPTAKSVLLPSDKSIPSTPATRTRRPEGGAGGGATKRRKTDAGDSTGTATPADPGSTSAKLKGKGKEKETAPAEAKATATPNPAAATAAAPRAAPTATATDVPSMSATVPPTSVPIPVPTSVRSVPAPVPSTSAPPTTASTSVSSWPASASAFASAQAQPAVAKLPAPNITPATAAPKTVTPTPIPIPASPSIPSQTTTSTNIDAVTSYPTPSTSVTPHTSTGTSSTPSASSVRSPYAARIRPTRYPAVRTTTAYASSGAPTAYTPASTAYTATVYPASGTYPPPPAPTLYGTSMTQSSQALTVSPTAQGGTLHQALPPQRTSDTSRTPVQHVSAGRPGEGVTVLGAVASAQPSPDGGSGKAQ
ncbi:hypothetical protein BDV93DRAFT_608745 [Ceratobasidium sp. AG-I]|nr:hypothetical protein BDV93DRAFT_608745 [Ceratobasidium sp. AG-I]